MTKKVHAIRFKQWLPEWDDFDFDESQHRRKPDDHILLFSMSARQLRSLSGVYRRTRDQKEGEGLQRLHDPKRSKAIRDFVKYGHPYSGLPDSARNEQSAEMRKPGWLPTAIVVNILTASDERRGRKVAAKDLVTVDLGDDGRADLIVPYGNPLDAWSPDELEPFEVIDGQHRLWAFDEISGEDALPGDFELPVVAFTGLDIGWQAYLFWSINVSPKRINPSHAFDLFPLLRSAAWLETFSDLKIYRQARAQELTEILFTQPESPFYNRINMLGEGAKTAPEGAGVSQSGWVQSITTSFLSGGGGRSPKGLFATEISPTLGPLDWSRPQQAAFLILLWDEIRQAVLTGKHVWALELNEYQRDLLDVEPDLTSAFSGPRTMLNQEQGTRGVLAVANEIFFALAQKHDDIFFIKSNVVPGTATTIKDVSVALEEFRQSKIFDFIRDFATRISSFDWRSADAPKLDEATRLLKRAFRGGSGYVALRERLFMHISQNNSDEMSAIAESCYKKLVQK